MRTNIEKGQGGPPRYGLDCSSCSDLFTFSMHFFLLFFSPSFSPVIEPTVFKHYNYLEMVRFLQSYANRYPHIASLYSIGTSVEGRILYVMEISDNPGIHEPGKQHMPFAKQNGFAFHKDYLILGTGM